MTPKDKLNEKIGAKMREVDGAERLVTSLRVELATLVALRQDLFGKRTVRNGSGRKPDAEKRAALVKLLAEESAEDGLGLKAIAEKLGISYEAAKQRMKLAVRDGEAERVSRGHFRSASKA